MKRKKRIITVLLLALFVVQGAGGYEKASGNTKEEISQEALTRALDTAMAAVVADGKAVGATATMVMNGEVILQKGYGYSDKEKNLPVDVTRTGFRIASISKTFVAIAALLAEQEGKLDLNADVERYLEKDFPALEYPVTMKQLLTHTAGFEDLITGIAVKSLSDIKPLSETVRAYQPKQIFQPGVAISYSNYGIALAGYVIEKATGIDFARYCRDRIFFPLGMNSTSFDYRDNELVYSKAYEPSGKEVLEPYINMYPEGSVVSSAEDMSKYIGWLLDGQESILNQKQKEKLLTCNFTMAEELNGIGYTWNIKDRNGLKYYEKKGEAVNFYSRIVLYPDSNIGMFFSFNTYVPEQEIDAVTDQVTTFLLGKEESLTSRPGATMKLEGSYVNARSSFDTAEKFLDYIIPEKRVAITGSLSEGFMLNGEPMTHLGENAYHTSIGTVKFMVKGGKTLLATDFSQTYIKVSTLESIKVIAPVSLLFLLSTIIAAIWSVILLCKKRVIPKSLIIMNILHFIAIILLVAILLLGISDYSILAYVGLIKLSSWIILIITILNVIILALKGNYDIKMPLIKYQFVHTVISISFCLVLYNLNFLL